MPILEFGPFEPDKVDSSTSVNTATNVFPAAIGYKKVPNFAMFSLGVSESPLGSVVVKDKDANVFNFVGTATKLFQLSSGSEFVDSSDSVYSTASGDHWEFIHWKERVIATNFADFPRVITLGGSSFSILTSDLKARHVAVVRSFVVFANTFDSSDGQIPYRIRWSAIDDENSYAISPTTLADFQDLKGLGGQITAVVGGEFGVIFQERSIWRMSFVGSPAVFQFDQVVPSRGTRAPRSVVSAGRRIFFLSQDGFEMLIDGTTSIQIGAGRVDRTFFEDLDSSNIDNINGVVDIKNNQVWWAYPGKNNINGRPNKIILYDWVFDKWSIIEIETTLLTTGATTGVSLDDLDSIAASQGAEQIVNGGFVTDTDWTKGTGWSIGSGVATHVAGTASDLEQVVGITENSFFFVTYTVSGRTAGTVTLEVGGTSGTVRSTNGTFTETVGAGAGVDIKFKADSAFAGIIDNVSIKQTSLDFIASSLDSDDFVGGAFQIAAFNELFELGFFTGAALPATIDTIEQQFTAGRRSRISGFRPLINTTTGASVTTSIQIATRNRYGDVPVFGPSTAEKSTGNYSRRSNARYHRFRLSITGEFDDAVGIDVESVRPSGRR